MTSPGGDRQRVVYEAVADFSSVRRELRRVRTAFQEAERAESSYNQNSATGAARTDAARREAARATDRQRRVMEQLTSALVANTAATRAASSSQDRLAANQDQAARTAAANAAAQALQTAAMAASTAEARRLADALNNANRRGPDPFQHQNASIQAFIRQLQTATQSIQDAARSMDNATERIIRRSRQIRDAGNSFKQLHNILKGLSGPLVILGAALTGLLSMVQPLIAAIIALGAAAVAAVTSLGSIAASLLAIVPAAAAVGAAVGAIVVAFRNIGGAFKAYSNLTKEAGRSTSRTASQILNATKAIASAEDNLHEARRNAARDIPNQNRAILQAQRALVDSQKGVIDAQINLTRARQSALATLQALRREVRGQTLDEEAGRVALIQAQEARDRIRSDPGSSRGDRAAADLGVRQAEADLAETRRRGTESQRELNKAEHEGVEGSDEVKRAKEDLAAANERVADSQDELRRTQDAAAESQRNAARAIADAMRAVADANRQAAESQDAGKDAAQQLEEQLAKLSPSARAVVEGLHSMSDAWAGIRQQVQENFFAPLVGQLDNIRGFLPTLNTLLGTAATALGQVAAKGIAMMTSGPFAADFRTIAGRNATLIKTMGDAALFLMDAFRHLAMAAGPFLQEIAQALKIGAQNFARFMREARESGKLARYLEVVRDRMHDWWQIIKNTGIALANIARAAFPFTQSMTKGLVDITAKWRRMTDAQSTGGAKWRKFFTDIRPLITEIGKLFSSMAKGFASVGSDTTNIRNAIRMLQQLRTEFGPALGRLFKALDFEKIGSGFIDSLTAMTDTLTNFLNAGGADAIKRFHENFSRIFGDFARFVANPRIAPTIGKIAGALASMAAVATVGKFTGINALVGYLAKLSIQSGTAGNALRRFSGLLGALPGPLKVVGVGLGLLTAASPKFRDALSDAGERIMHSLEPLVGLLAELVTWLGDKLGGAIDKLVSFLNPFVDAVEVIVRGLGAMPPILQAVEIGLIAVTFALKRFWAALGPIGWAILGVSVALDFVIGLFQKKEEIVKRDKEAIDNLKTSLDKLTGAYTDLTKEQVLNTLATQQGDNGKTVLENLNEAGISVSDFIDATLGVPGALDKVNIALEGNRRNAILDSQAYDNLTAITSGLHSTMELSAEDLVAYSQGQEAASRKVYDYTQRLLTQIDAKERDNTITHEQAETYRGWVRDLQEAGPTLSGLTDKVKVFDSIESSLTQTTNDNTIASDEYKTSLVNRGKALSYINGVLRMSAEQFRELYIAEHLEGETAEQFIFRMSKIGVVVSSSKEAIRLINEEMAKNPGTPGIDNLNEKLERTITLAQQAREELAQTLGDQITQLTDPSGLAARAEERINAGTAAATSTPAGAAAGTGTPAGYDYEGAQRAENAASDARDATIKAAEDEADATKKAADDIKKARLEQADAEEKAAQATVDAADKRVVAAEREADKATTAADKTGKAADRAQDRLDTARGDLYAAQHVRVEAERGLATAKTPEEKKHFQDIIDSAKADEEAARQRLGTAEKNQQVAADKDTKAQAAKKKADDAVTAAKKKLDDAETAADAATGTKQTDRAAAEAAYTHTVEEATKKEQAARESAEAAYEAVLRRQRDAETAATAATQAASDSTVGAVADVPPRLKPSWEDLQEQRRIDKEKVDAWKADILTIYKKAGPEFALEIAKLGPEQAAVAAELAEKTPAQLKVIADAWGTSGTAAGQLFLSALTAVVTGETTDGITPTMGQGILDDLEAGLLSVPEIAKKYGVQFSENASGTLTVTVIPPPDPTFSEERRRAFELPGDRPDTQARDRSWEETPPDTQARDRSWEESGMTYDPTTGSFIVPISYKPELDEKAGTQAETDAKAQGLRMSGAFTSSAANVPSAYKTAGKDSVDAFDDGAKDAKTTGQKVHDAFTAPFTTMKTFFAGAGADAVTGIDVTDGFTSKGTEARDGFLVPFGDEFKTQLTTKVTEARDGAVATFSTLATLLAVPVNTFVSTVMNKTLIPAFNTVIDFIGGTRIKPATVSPVPTGGNPTVGANVGGFIGGNRTGPDRDTVPAYLTPGEFVFRRRAVRAIGLDRLYALNELGGGDPKRRRYNTGGLATAFPGLNSKTIGKGATGTEFSKTGSLLESGTTLAALMANGPAAAFLGLIKPYNLDFGTSGIGKILNGAVREVSTMFTDYLSGNGRSGTGFVPGTPVTGPPGQGVSRWAPLASTALLMAGQYSPANLDALLHQMDHESSGNPNAINLTDANALAGTPSKGLLQVIDSTFASYAQAPFNRNIYDPLSNMLAAIRYTVDRYGSLNAGWTQRGYIGYNAGGLAQLLNGGGLVDSMRGSMIAPSILQGSRARMNTSEGGISNTRSSQVSIQNLNVNNPKPERATESIPRMIRRQGYLMSGSPR